MSHLLWKISCGIVGALGIWSCTYTPGRLEGDSLHAWEFISIFSMVYIALRDFRAKRTPKVFVFLCNALFMTAFCRIRMGRVSTCRYIRVFASHDSTPCVAEASAPF